MEMNECFEAFKILISVPNEELRFCGDLVENLDSNSNGVKLEPTKSTNFASNPKPAISGLALIILTKLRFGKYKEN